jgi:hypothetical protein
LVTAGKFANPRRAGLTDRIKAHGWHAVAAQRTALLDSLWQDVAGWALTGATRTLPNGFE